MEKKNYICNSCGNVFLGWNEPNECAVCHSHNFTCKEVPVEELERQKRLQEEQARAMQEKNEEKQRELLKNLTDLNKVYEYDVVTVVDNRNGSFNSDKVKEIINKKAEQRWRLISVSSNELGKNALSLSGFGINSTVDETVLVFERCKKDFGVM